jgi:hypothetical protein
MESKRRKTGAKPQSTRVQYEWRSAALEKGVLASYEICVAGLMDVDAVVIPDPEGHHRHIDDWRSNDGKTQSKAATHCPI